MKGIDLVFPQQCLAVFYVILFLYAVCFHFGTINILIFLC